MIKKYWFDMKNTLYTVYYFFKRSTRSAPPDERVECEICCYPVPNTVSLQMVITNI